MIFDSLVQEAADDASADMGTAQAAADTISAAIAAVMPWLGGQTWTGATASAWQGDWSAAYDSARSVLGDLPAVESDVVSAVRAQAEQSLEAHHGV
jgi:hypothetical protein